MRIVIISVLSGSGKSIALNMLEDAAYYCVDNLPSPLLKPLVDQLAAEGYDKVAAAIDIRGGESIATLPQQLAVLRREGLVETRREGKQIFYRISSPAALAVINTLYQQFCGGAQ